MLKPEKKIEALPFKKKPWHSFQHMVFDLDGTLLNSNLAHVWSWQDAMEAERIFMPHQTMFMQMGLPGKQIIEKFGHLFKDETTAKKVKEAAGKLYTERYADLVAPFDGAVKLLKTLSAQGKQLYAITSAGPKEANKMLKHFKLEPYFSLVITSQDTEEGKPSPEPFLALKEKLGARADMISLGDSPYDLKASHSAGVPFVYLGQGGYPREWFTRAYASFFSIKHLLDSMPSRSNARYRKSA